MLLDHLRSGKSLAVISDGGSPGLSDPAYRIVTAAIEEGISVEALPGPTALIPALTASGLPTDRFHFEGFLPVKSGKRRKRLEELSAFPHTLVIYESVHRIKKTLADIVDIFDQRKVVVAREVSKIHEEYIRGTAAEVRDRIEQGVCKGEFVIIIHGCRDGD
jgi:16S rRNA (cytidine1402-2'-O)-methyltransferase